MLNKKGKTIMTAFQKQYGPAKGKRIFYAAENKGTIKGIKRKPHKVKHSVMRG